MPNPARSGRSPLPEKSREPRTSRLCLVKRRTYGVTVITGMVSKLRNRPQLPATHPPLG